MKEKYSDFYEKLGLNVAYYRNLKKMTQEQLGDKVGIDQTHVSRIERAAVGISIDLLFDLATALEVEPYKLMLFRE